MRYTVTLTLDSPALVGDRREPSAYFLPSRDFIPGGVLRAAFARAITENCPYYTDGERLHWVRFADGPDCQACSWRGLCASFAGLRFSHLYKDGARVAPLAAYRCKFDGNHPVFDTLLGIGEPRCPACGMRAERFKGYLDAGYREVSVARRLVMRLAVDPYRGVTQDRYLYALRVLEKGQTFRGWLAIPEGAGPIPAPTELRLGAKTTVGLGRATVRFERAGVPDSGDLRRRIARFQEKARNRLERSGEGETEGYTYFSLTLLADVLPERVLAPRSERVPTATLRQELAQAILPFGSPLVGRGVEAVKVVVDFKVYGGYCTAERGYGRREAALHIAAGSVFLYRVRGALDDGLLQSLQLLEEQGVGAKTEDGYGAVCICDRFHLEEG